MRCPNCGADLTEDSFFCSYCGFKMNSSEKREQEQNNQEQENQGQEEQEQNSQEFTGYNNATTGEYYCGQDASNSSNKKSKGKMATAWSKLSLFYKVVVVSMAVIVFLFLIALLTRRTAPAVIAALQVVLIILGILMEKDIIKVPKKWLYIIPLVIALLLLWPYWSTFGRYVSGAENFKWSDMELSELIPEPVSHYGKIISNSEDGLSLYVYRMSNEKYEDYVEECKEAGFSVDVEERETYFQAYDGEGYELSLYYYKRDNSMRIYLDAVREYGNISWPDSGMASMLPVPESTKGEIVENDDSMFCAYVSDTSYEKYEEYVDACIELGFTIDSYSGEKSYSAYNGDGYLLSIYYEGNNVISVALEEPEYEITIEVECEENLIFSKYDVKIYVDDDFEGTLDHGTTDTYMVYLTKGSHEITFVDSEDDEVTGSVKMEISASDSFKYKIYCTSTGIDVDIIDGTEEDESAASEISSKSEITTEKQMESEEEEVATENKSSTEEDTDEKTDSLNYTTNTKDTVLNGNSGVYAYSDNVGDFDIYWIIDFDEGYVYWFMYYSSGTDSTTCDRVKIDSGDLNTGLVLVYHEADDYTWTQTLTFTFPDLSANIITLEDSVGDEYYYYATDLDKALSIRDERIMFDY